MKALKEVLVLLMPLSPLILGASFSGRDLNNRPIIGILSQGITDSLDSILPPGHNFTTYIAASYVKWVEGAGARAVPIVVNSETSNLEYYVEMFAGINGILIPGGAVSIYNSPYAEASTYLFQLAKLANEANEVFPVWGTCLGFEMLGAISNEGEPYLKHCNSYDQALPLELVDGWSESELLGEAREDIINDLTQKPVTANFHHWCLTQENFTQFDMDSFWNILSLNTDEDGLEFISTMEAKNYPIFATQWHPEKNNYEWTTKYPNIPHSREAVEISEYFANFFVDKARMNSHRFSSRDDEEKHLIYNYEPFYSGKDGRDFGFQQVYLF